MSRPQVCVRRLDDSLKPELEQLWVRYRIEAGCAEETALRSAADGTLWSIVGREGVVTFVACLDTEAVGYLVLSDSVGGLLTDAPSTAIDQLYVSSAWRHHGVARQLLAAAAAHADRVGADTIITNVPSQGRDANRFFARLGFWPTVVRRVTTPAALQRRLAAHTDGMLGLEQVLHRRRTARLRAGRQRATAVREV